jgi:hypothetical protein
MYLLMSSIDKSARKVSPLYYFVVHRPKSHICQAKAKSAVASVIYRQKRAQCQSSLYYFVVHLSNRSHICQAKAKSVLFAQTPSCFALPWATPVTCSQWLLACIADYWAWVDGKAGGNNVVSICWEPYYRGIVPT